MKKIFAIILLTTMFILPATAQQPDTLYMRNRDRVPNYYYWDSNWADIYWNSSSFATWGGPANKYVVARHFYTDSSLKIIGMAGIKRIYTEGESWRYYDTCFENRMPDYMILYEATDSSFVALDSVRIDTTSARFRYNIPESRVQSLYDISEVYFSKPYTVYDSFYIACTHNNSFRYLDADREQWYTDYNYPLQYLFLYADADFRVPHPGDAKPGYMKVIYRTLPPTNDSSMMQWHWESTTQYLCVFPIFDTTGMTLPDTPPADDSCYAVTGLRVVGINHSSPTLTWEVAHGQNAWQIAYGPSGTTPEEGTLQQVAATSFTTLPQLDTAQWYVAYIRADCDTVSYSEWSDSVRFYIPGDTATVFIDDLSPQERHTTLFPNPAQTHCSLFSSFHISHVELFTLQGQRLLQQPVQGLSTEIDIATLPRGNYVIAIHTAAGTVTKILTKQ